MVVPVVALDTGGEPWRAAFPGLGTVRVFEDGQVSVEVASGPGSDQRFAALSLGWAEPLSWLRRGYHLTAASVTAPNGRALIVIATYPQQVVVLKTLTDHGWSILADAMTPIRELDAGFEVYGRNAPVIVAQRLAGKWGLAGEPLRADSDALAVDLPRGQGPNRVAGVLQVRTQRSTDRPNLEEISGAKRLELASGLIRRAPGSCDPSGPAQVMAQDLKMAALPMARMHLADRQSELDVSDVLRWWETI